MEKEILNYLESLQGLGPILSRDLYDKIVEEFKLKSPTLTEIKKLLTNQKIFKDLPKETQMDLKFNPLKEIPRKLISKFEEEFNKLGVKFFIGGSYSRGKSHSGDIDLLLLKNTEWPELASRFNQNSKMQFSDVISQGSNRITTYLKVENQYLRVDIFLTTEQEWIFMVLYLVGSGRFNLLMRSIAKKKGFLLNQHGLFKDKENIGLKFTKEEEIFQAIKFEYRDWSQRDL